MKTDPQAKRLYHWEDAHVMPHAHPLRDLRACGEFLLRASAWMDLPKPRIMVTKLNISCWAKPSENLIRIAPWGRNPAVLLHEVAHIADYRFNPGSLAAAHGPSFLALAMDLYANFLGLERESLGRTAAAMGLHFSASRFASRSTAAPVSEDDFFEDDF